MAASSGYKSKVERMEDKRNDLIGQFNQLRLELGAIEMGIGLANKSKAKVISKLEEVQAQYEKVSKELDRLKAQAGNPPEPEVGLTEDAKREMAEVVKVRGQDEADATTAPTVSETPAA